MHGVVLAPHLYDPPYPIWHSGKVSALPLCHKNQTHTATHNIKILLCVAI
jgi:hypothetical protein